MNTLHDNTMRVTPRTLFSLLFLLAWCFAPITTPADEGQAEATAEGFKKGEHFTLRAAMATAFGNVREGNTSVFQIDLPPDLRGSFGGKEFVAEPAAYQEFESEGKQYLYLVTASTPLGEDFFCHICSPLLSFFVFEKTGDSWELTYSKKDFLVAGTYGKPPEIGFTRIGQEQHALLLKISDYHMGYINGYIVLYLYDKEQMQQIFSTYLYNIFEHNYPDDTPEETFFTFTDVFFAPSDSRHYIIKTVTYGLARAEQSPNKVIPVNTTQYFVYDESKKEYVQSQSDPGSLQFTLFVSGCLPEELPVITARNYLHALANTENGNLPSLPIRNKQQPINKNHLPKPLSPLDCMRLRRIEFISQNEYECILAAVADVKMKNKPLESQRFIFNLVNEGGSWKISSVERHVGQSIGGCHVPVQDYKAFFKKLSAKRRAVKHSMASLANEHDAESRETIRTAAQLYSGIEQSYDTFQSDCRDDFILIDLKKITAKADTLIQAASAQEDRASRERRSVLRCIRQIRDLASFFHEQATVITSRTGF